MIQTMSDPIHITSNERMGIKHLRSSDFLAVLKPELFPVIRKYMPKSHLEDREIITVGKIREHDNPIQIFATLLGFKSSDSLYNFMDPRIINKWVALDRADMILCRIGAQHVLNTGEITIYKIQGQMAYPLPYE